MILGLFIIFGLVVLTIFSVVDVARSDKIETTQMELDLHSETVKVTKREDAINPEVGNTNLQDVAHWDWNWNED